MTGEMLARGSAWTPIPFMLCIGEGCEQRLHGSLRLSNSGQIAIVPFNEFASRTYKLTSMVSMLRKSIQHCLQWAVKAAWKIWGVQWYPHCSPQCCSVVLSLSQVWWSDTVNPCQHKKSRRDGPWSQAFGGLLLPSIGLFTSGTEEAERKLWPCCWSVVTLSIKGDESYSGLHCRQSAYAPLALHALLACTTFNRDQPNDQTWTK